MRMVGLFVFILLSTSILSYGLTGIVFADSHNVPPLSVSTDTKIYANGGNVVVTGKIRDYDPSVDSGKAVTFILKSPENNLVTIGQFNPKSDGSFERTFVAGGPLWKLSGDYTLELHFGANTAEAKINYVGGEQVISKPKPPVVTEPPAPITCASDQELVNGKCIDKEPPAPITCASDQELVNGKCIDKEPPAPVVQEPICGAGTELVNGVCQVIKGTKSDDKGGGCLIATAAYGTELAPQVQFLREVRDNTVLSTASGVAFMSGFNSIYYSFAPSIADMERENPLFQEAVRAFITPMISTLSIMALADEGSEAEVLGLGISVIALNLGMYVAAPALIGFKVHNHIKSRK